MSNPGHAGWPTGHHQGSPPKHAAHSKNIPTRKDFMQAADAYGAAPAFAAQGFNAQVQQPTASLPDLKDDSSRIKGGAEPQKPRGVTPWLEGVTSPCEHKDPADWKRLRLKKGMQQLLCFKCGTKWKVPFRPSGANNNTVGHEAMQGQPKATPQSQGQWQDGGAQRPYGLPTAVWQPNEAKAPQLWTIQHSRPWPANPNAPSQGLQQHQPWVSPASAGPQHWQPSPPQPQPTQTQPQPDADLQQLQVEPAASHGESTSQAPSRTAVLFIPQSLTEPALPTYMHSNNDKQPGSDMNLASKRLAAAAMWNNNEDFGSENSQNDPLLQLNMDQRWQVALKSGRGFILSASADLNAVRRGSVPAEPTAQADQLYTFLPSAEELNRPLSGLSTGSGEADPPPVKKAETHPAQQFAGVVCPCEHKDPTSWKRLRLKKGMQHFLCLECGTKWKSPSLNSANNKHRVDDPETAEVTKKFIHLQDPQQFKIEVPGPVASSTSMDIPMLKAYMIQNDPNLRSTKSFVDLKHMVADEICTEVPASYSYSFEKAGLPESYSLPAAGRLPKASLDVEELNRGIIKSWTLDHWDRTGNTDWIFDSSTPASQPEDNPFGGPSTTIAQPER
eukprot:GGOE01012293.1.p1 GENE.GGOE01012293.1~~GGOE01012293.1.p1  ORF type:complete len:704 (+),score=143.57 GGOE01012293.1:269-2113(+)